MHRRCTCGQGPRAIGGGLTRTQPVTALGTMQESKALLIFPCGGNGLEALDCIGAHHRLVGFIDDAPERQGKQLFGYPIFGREALARWPDADVLAVPGSPTSFKYVRRVIEGLAIDPVRFANLIHRTAVVSPLAMVGRNILLMAGVVVTSNAVIGSHVCVLPNSVIHHDVQIGDFSLLGSNVTVAGGVTLGENCYIASGTSIMHGVRVGSEALVGLGART